MAAPDLKSLRHLTIILLLSVRNQVRNAADMVYHASLLILAGINALAVNDAAPSAPITVMSFNVRYGSAPDGEDAWPRRRDILIETIRRYDPDIVGTQECLEFQAEYIVQELPAYRWFGAGRTQGPALTDEMTAILYKKDVFTPLETGTFWLSETPDHVGSKSWDSSLPRITTWARFRHRASGRQFYCFNTHFDHRGATAREMSAGLVAQRIQNLPSEMSVILTGDFNAPAETSAPWKSLTQCGLQDAWLTAAEHTGPTGTFHGFKGTAADSGGRIDWILYRGPLQAVACETIEYNDGGRYPSDHYPVLCRLEWTDTRE